MRILLHTGPGGTGKTTVATATAILAASCGHRTVLLRADPSVGDLGDLAAHGGVPSLTVAEVGAAASIGELWPGIRSYLVSALGVVDLAPVQSEELPLPPGAPELATLLAIGRHAAAADVLVVDSEPEVPVARLLALPEVLRFYLDRLLSTPLRMVRAGTAGVPDAIGSLLDELDAARDLLADSDVSTVSLVLSPDRRAVAAGRRTATGLAVHGVQIGRVVVDRLLPDVPALAPWRRAQDDGLAAVAASFGELAPRTVSTTPGDPVDLPALLHIGDELFDGRDPAAAVPRQDVPVPGPFTLALPLPFVERDDVDLLRVGDELVVTAAGTRRRILLPSTLRRCRTDGARIEQGQLVVDFVPDPGQWPTALWTGQAGTNLAGVG